MNAWRRLVSEPLLQFLLVGAVLYLLWGMWASDEASPDARRISVTRAPLLEFVQRRAGAFDAAAAAARLDALDGVQREQLIEDYVRDEALYREAQALGLAEGDEVMRQRLIEKMGFLLEAQPPVSTDEAELAAYYERHAGAYLAPPTWTFTHVFFDAQARGDDGARRGAARLLAAMNRERVAAAESDPYGDAYPFLRHYVDRGADYVGGHFGAEYAAALAQMTVHPGRWQGPVRSDRGWHVVMLNAKSPGRQPAFAEVRELAAADLQRERQAAAREAAIAALIARYEVVVAPEFASP